jgi:hypothetical protein
LVQVLFDLLGNISYKTNGLLIISILVILKFKYFFSGILRAPRASSTEALVLSVPYRPPFSLEPNTVNIIKIKNAKVSNNLVFVFVSSKIFIIVCD